jgi:hypothetical protein
MQRKYRSFMKRFPFAVNNTTVYRVLSLLVLAFIIFICYACKLAWENRVFILMCIIKYWGHESEFNISKVKLSRYRHAAIKEGRKYISYSFLTSELNGVSGRHALAALYAQERKPVPIVQEAGWTLESVWTQRLEEKILCFCQGSNPGLVRSQTLYWLCYPSCTEYNILRGN